MARVLIVDDEEMAGDVMATTLRRAGHDAVAVQNCRSALAELSREDFDAVITDVFMPDCDGIELIRAVRQVHPSLPVLAVTGGGSLGTAGILDMIVRLGATATLKKPFNFNALVHNIEQMTGPGGAAAGTQALTIECEIARTNTPNDQVPHTPARAGNRQLVVCGSRSRARQV